MKWDPKKVREESERDFEKQWMKGVSLVPEPGGFKQRERKGQRLVAQDILAQSRDTLIGMGYDEMSLPVFVDEKDIGSQYGPETPVVLDCHYYLAMLPKAEVTLSEDKVSSIKEIAKSFNDGRRKKLEELIERYRLGKIKGNKFVDGLVDGLGVRMEQATQIVKVLFPQPAEMVPVPSNLLLRCGLNSAWFDTIAAMAKKESMPIQMFSTGLCFRNMDNPESDELRAYNGISILIVDENISAEDGKAAVTSLAKALGARDAQFSQAVSTAKVYVPGTQHEIAIIGPLGKSVEVGEIGMLSPTALSRYGIGVPVFCASLNAEKMAMALGGIESARMVMYPQFYGDWKFSDAEIAALVRINEPPQTEMGRVISKKIVQTCDLYYNQKSPCEFKVFEKELGDNKLEVWVVEERIGGSLCGPAFINDIYVYDGNVLGLPPSGFEDKQIVKDARQKGIKTGVRMINAFADYCASQIEKTPAEPKRFQVKNVRRPEDVNISVPTIVQRYVASKGKSMNLRGPMFVTVETRVKKLWVHEQPRQAK